MAEGLFEFHKAFVLKKLTDGAVLTCQYCSTEPPVFEYWRLGTENSHCPFFVFALLGVVCLHSAALTPRFAWHSLPASPYSLYQRES